MTAKSGRWRVESGSAWRWMTVACLLVGIAGCKTGTSMAPPSWWKLGGSNPADASKLAAAPPFDGKITKPSETATPYPTTSTPNGYVSTSGEGGAPAVPPQIAAAAEQPPVIYGTTPPPSARQPEAAAVVAAAPPAAAAYPATSGQPGGAIAPQVGPYAALAGQAPAASQAPPAAATPIDPLASLAQPSAGPLPPMQAATQPSPLSTPAAGSGFPSTAGYEPAARIADARTAEAFAPATAAAAAATADSRYANAGSRFGGGQPAAVPPASHSMPDTVMPPAMQPAFSTSPAAAPAASPLPAAPASAPAMPGMPPATPARRPDPVYRPFGTSSYRPSREMLVDQAPVVPPSGGPVRTAAFEVPEPAASR